MYRIKCLFNLYRIVVADIILFLVSENDKKVILQDLYQYQNYNNKLKRVERKTLYKILNYILVSDLSYKSVFSFRLEKYKIKKIIFDLFWHPLKTIEINCIDKEKGIDGGLWISHNYCIISVQYAGKNLRVGPGVTIGMKNDGSKIINPIIGDNVYIATNSTVIGGIKIGDNTTIGAGSVVVKDCESNSIYVGNPAKKIK